MKKSLFIIAAVLLIAGCQERAIIDYKDIIAEGQTFKNINISGGSLTVEIARGKNYSVKGIIAAGETLSAAVKNGALNIAQSAPLCDKAANKCKGDIVKITVPADFACDSAAISLGSGNIIIENLVCNGIDLSTLSGNIAMAGASVSTANINAQSGNIRLQDSEIASADIKTASGNVSGRMITLYEAYINTDSGSIGLEGTFKNTLNMTTSSGNISLDSSLPAADYYKQIETEHGSIYINGRHMGNRHLSGGDSAVNRLVAVSNSGNINLSFVQ